MSTFTALNLKTEKGYILPKPTSAADGLEQMSIKMATMPVMHTMFLNIPLYNFLNFIF